MSYSTNHTCITPRFPQGINYMQNVSRRSPPSHYLQCKNAHAEPLISWKLDTLTSLHKHNANTNTNSCSWAHPPWGCLRCSGRFQIYLSRASGSCYGIAPSFAHLCTAAIEGREDSMAPHSKLLRSLFWQIARVTGLLTGACLYFVRCRC